MSRRRVLLVRRIGTGNVGAAAVTCEVDSDCPDQGKTCIAGVCIAKPCQTGDDCGQYGHCRSAGFCQPDTHECSADTDCPDGTICSDNYCIPKAGKFIKPWSSDDDPAPVAAGPCKSTEVIKQVQRALGVDDDSDWGKLSQAALDAQGGDFKAFAPGCTGAVPHWTQSGGNQPIPCKDEGKACTDKNPCCGALVCRDGVCAKPAPKDTSPAWWWIFGGLAFGVAIVGVAYATGSIGGPRKNPLSGYGREPTRIGVAFTRPRGKKDRQDQYGIYESAMGGMRYAQYEGYREQSPRGEVMVGLPLGGPGAAHLQPHIDFDPKMFGEVRYF